MAVPCFQDWCAAVAWASMVDWMDLMLEALGFFTKLSMSCHRSGSQDCRSSRLNTNDVACSISAASAMVTGSG